jgi:hypothetical protein
MEECATQAIMELYRVSREVALEFYWDEIQAYLQLIRAKNEQTNS